MTEVDDIMAVRAVIFDMDGMLTDSEPLWRIASVESLNAVGVPLTEYLRVPWRRRRIGLWWVLVRGCCRWRRWVLMPLFLRCW